MGHTPPGRGIVPPARFIPTYVGHTRPAAPVPGPARFIPTYVGHTIFLTGKLPAIPVHPHIRGAYPLRWMRSPSARGSSPHTWGIRSWVRSMATKPLVHPHIRGAYFVGGNVVQPQGGSSPHTWGIPVQVVRRFYGVRFIPTYVGHTIAGLPFPIPDAVHPHIRGAYTGPP